MVAQGNAHLCKVESEESLEEEFVAFISGASYPCLGAKAAINAEAHTIEIYDELAAAGSTFALARALEAFISSPHPSQYATFIAIFRGPEISGEEQFEDLLWSQLRQLHRWDKRPWDDDVSPDPNDPHFSFSFAGRALYVIGIHPHSSRIARR